MVFVSSSHEELKLFMIDSRVLRYQTKKKVNQIFVEWQPNSCNLLRTNNSQKLLKKIEAKICCVISEQTAYPPSATHSSLHRDTSFNELHDVKSRWVETSRKSIDMKWFFLLRPYTLIEGCWRSHMFLCRESVRANMTRRPFFCCCCVWFLFTIFMLRPSYHSYFFVNHVSLMR